MHRAFGVGHRLNEEIKIRKCRQDHIVNLGKTIQVIYFQMYIAKINISTDKRRMQQSDVLLFEKVEYLRVRNRLLQVDQVELFAVR